jgi:hypothetical protein
MSQQQNDTLPVELPNNFDKYDEQIKADIISYIKQMSPIECHAYTIGKEHLGSSFNIIKSNGFISWKKKQ